MLAGAGTGKTAALTARLAHLLYTRRAWPSRDPRRHLHQQGGARDAASGSAGIVGDAVEGMPWLGTFHSIGAKMLRRHAELVGLQSNFTILDTDDQLRLLKQLIPATDIDEKRWPARALAGLIDRWKNKGWTPQQVDAGESRGLSPTARAPSSTPQYQERLKALNACDFGDLLLHMLVILQDPPRRAGALPAALQIYPGRRISGHQPGPVSLAPPARPGAQEHLLRRRRRPVASIPGAAPRSPTSCASRRTFPAPRSSGSSRITARPRTSSPPPPA